MSPSTEAPPAGNTGALTPEVWVDYVRVTFPDDIELGLVLECLGGGEGWLPTERGALGYARGLRKGHVSVWYQGRQGMGTHVDITGQGCRELEAGGAVRDWSEWVRKVWDFGGRFSRFDVALDDRSKMLNLRTIENKVRKGAFVSVWRSGRIEYGWSEGRQADQAETVYFGSRQSLVFGRIYNKALQVGLPAQSGRDEPPHWIRAELELKDERAEEFLKAALTLGFGKAASGVWRRYVEFIHEGTATRKERCRRCAWWHRFLQGCEAVSLSIAKVCRTLQDVADWLERQASVAVEMCCEVFGGEWLTKLLDRGRLKRKKHHQGLVNAALDAKVEKAIRELEEGGRGYAMAC